MTQTNEEKKYYTDLLPIITMGLFLIMVQIFSIMLAQPMEAEDLQFSDDPENIWYSVGYMGVILIFTLLILIAMKKQMKWVIHGFILFAVLLLSVSCYTLPSSFSRYILANALKRLASPRPPQNKIGCVPG